MKTLPNTPFVSARTPIPSNYVDADRSLIKNLLNKNIYNNLPGEIRNLIKSFQIEYKINENVTDIDPSYQLLYIYYIIIL